MATPSLQGFTEVESTVDEFEVHPPLPKDWPELTVMQIYVRPSIPGSAPSDLGNWDTN